MDCSHHRHGQDKTKLFCLVANNCVHTDDTDKTRQVLSCLNPVYNLHLLSLIKYIEDYRKLGNWKLGRDETKLSCLVCSRVHSSHRRHRLEKTVLCCPYWRCEQAIQYMISLETASALSIYAYALPHSVGVSKACYAHYSSNNIEAEKNKEFFTTA